MVLLSRRCKQRKCRNTGVNRIVININVKHNKPNILILDKKSNEILIVEFVITNQDLTVVENKELRKYNFLTNELGLVQKAKTKITPYVMT